MTAQTATQEAPDEDLEVILPPPGKVVIDGVECEVRHLRAREFFKLMGIVTNGIGPGLAQFRWNMDNREEMTGQLMAVLVMAIPEQLDQFLDLVASIVEPKGSVGENRRIRERLENPEIEDLLPIADAIITNERDNIWSLVGKARAYLERWKTTFASK